MTPEHLADYVARVESQLITDLQNMKESAYAFNDKEFEWHMADIHRQFYFTRESLSEFRNAIERHINRKEKFERT